MTVESPKRPRGRPVGTGNGRTARIELQMSPESKVALQEIAKRWDMTPGEWVESCVRYEQTFPSHEA